MNHKYISKQTYEVLEDVFEVDPLIAETVITLNKKGYRTTFCCQGHEKNEIHKYKVPKEKYSEKLTKNIAEYDMIEKANEVIIYYKIPSTDIYIKFDKDYGFKKLPEGFEKLKKWDYKNNDFYQNEYEGIIKTIYFYDKNERKSKDKIKDEIEKSNKDLYEWSKKLPNIN